jgi:hypothetical protein
MLGFEGIDGGTPVSFLAIERFREGGLMVRGGLVGWRVSGERGQRGRVTEEEDR